MLEQPACWRLAHWSASAIWGGAGFRPQDLLVFSVQSQSVFQGATEVMGDGRVWGLSGNCTLVGLIGEVLKKAAFRNLTH